MTDPEREPSSSVVPISGDQEHLLEVLLHGLDSPVTIRNAIIVGLCTLSNEAFVELIQAAVRESHIEEKELPGVDG